MNNDALIFVAIFIIATTIICAGVVMVALNRIGSAASPRKRRPSYRSATAHRAFKDVM